MGPIEAGRRRVAKSLLGFTPDFSRDFDTSGMTRHRPNRKDFPVPELVLFMLRNLMGWRWQGVGEKVRWSVYGSIGGEPVVFEYLKSGFSIAREPQARVPMSRVEGQLKSGLKHLERFLEPIADHQLERGEVLIVNRFREFDDRYRFFRRLADEAYQRAGIPPRPSRAKDDVKRCAEDMMAGWSSMFRANREGFFHSTAMVDSCFSALEHRLVLLRAFTGQPLKVGELLEILACKWDEKLRRIFPAQGDRHADQILGRMRRIKERVRNPFAHGGVEADRGSLFFHLPHVGAIPANFTRFGESVRFSLIPIETDDHAEICEVFDGLHDLLSRGPLAGPHTLMEAGIDPSFDAGALQEYADAHARGEEGARELIQRWGAAWERHANMDY